MCSTPQFGQTDMILRTSIRFESQRHAGGMPPPAVVAGGGLSWGGRIKP